MTQAVTPQVREMMDACASFEYFLRHHVKIRDVRDGITRVIQWEWWPEIHPEFVADMEDVPKLIQLKPRQVGGSWGWAARLVWEAMFTHNYLGGVISSGQAKTNSFLGKCRFIIQNLPKEVYVDPPLTADNTEKITFAATNGTIMAFPSTSDAGIGETFTRLVVDEAAFHPRAESNYGNYLPAIEQGQLVILSSMGEEDSGEQVTSDFFQRMWLGAPDNGFLARFYPYSVRPGRDEAWYAKTARQYAHKPGLMGKLYPRTAEEAFASMLLLRFDSEAIEEGRQACRPPLREIHLPDDYNTLKTPYLRLWSAPRPGVAYVAYTDPAEGMRRDYTCTGIMEARARRHVATMRENQMEPTQHGALAAKLCRWFDVKVWGIERAKGEGVFAAAGADPWTRARLYWHKGEQSRLQQRSGKEVDARLGFPMTEHTRRGLIDDLGEAIADRSFSSDDEVFWRECGLFMMRGDRPEAGPGAHDDLVIMMAGLLRMAGQPGATIARSAVLTTGRELETADRYNWNHGQRGA